MASSASSPLPSPTPGTVIPVQSTGHFDQLTQGEAVLSVSFFFADFHEACRPNGQLDVVFKQLAMLHPHLRFLKIAAEDECVADLAERLQITAVPTFVIAQGPTVLEKIEGANVATLATRVDALSKSVKTSTGASKPASEDAAKPTVDDALAYRLKKLISAAPVMLFMKGNPSEPRCGFSRQMVELLTAEEIHFSSFDILQDNDVREGLKVFSNWPTFPQLYVAGKLIGGLDIVKEMKAEGPLLDQFGLRKDAEKSDEELNQSLRALVQSAPVMLFMKGTPQEPKCGFSRKMVQLLRDQKIAFSSFDILSDEQVRQGLKKLYNWPTYPQLYVKGKLIGGLDILTEMAENGDLCEQLGVAKKPSHEEVKYEQLINRAPVMIFIKGTPQEPKCGFSRQLVELLNAEDFQYDYFDILSDESVRQGLKKFSNWPTYPQLYIKGKLVGGLDIVKQLREDGELAGLKP